MIEDRTFVSWVSPDGVVMPLSGYTRDSAVGVWLGDEPKNLGRVEVKAIFDAAARQIGETWVGQTVDHAEINLPLFILADSTPELRLQRAALQQIMPTERVGWLVVGTSTTGLRWVPARRLDMAPIFAKDLHNGCGLRIDVLLGVDQPYARTADCVRDWTSPGGSTVSGSVWVGGGPMVSWPEFVFIGPGRPRIRYGQVDFDLGIDVLAGERVLIVADQARPTVRGITATGVRRNLLPLLAGRKIDAPLRAGEVTRIDVSVTGGGVGTAFLATVPLTWEGLL